MTESPSELTSQFGRSGQPGRVRERACGERARCPREDAGRLRRPSRGTHVISRPAGCFVPCRSEPGQAEPTTTSRRNGAHSGRRLGHSNQNVILRIISGRPAGQRQGRAAQLARTTMKSASSHPPATVQMRPKRTREWPAPGTRRQGRPARLALTYAEWRVYTHSAAAADLNQSFGLVGRNPIPIPTSISIRKLGRRLARENNSGERAN
jgi:hypothetical protein